MNTFSHFKHSIFGGDQETFPKAALRTKPAELARRGISFVGNISCHIRNFQIGVVNARRRAIQWFRPLPVMLRVRTRTKQNSG